VLVTARDDDRRARMVDVVEQTGHRVIEALDGGHAVAVATRYVPDVLVVDAVLPQLDGLQLIARLKQNPDTSDVPAILVADAATAECVTADATLAVLTSIDDVSPQVLRFLRRRTASGDATIMLRRALADVRACAGDAAADDSAAASRRRARQMANGVEESMISVLFADDDAHYVEANAAVCALTGYSRAELLAMTIWDLTPQHRVGHDRRLWERFKRAGRFEGSYRIRRRGGESVTIRCVSSANVAPGLHVATMAPPRLLEVIRS